MARKDLSYQIFDNLEVMREKADRLPRTKRIDSAGINMTYQTTILTGGGVDGEIVFFMEIEIHKNPLVMDAVLILLAEMSKKMVVLGSFTREDVIEE